MPQISYRANLSAAIYPLSFAQAGRSVVVPGPDNIYDRRVDPEGQQTYAGIPQAIYMQNVIPTVEGYQSVGLKVKESVPVANYTVGITGISRFKDLLFVYQEGLSGYKQAYVGSADGTGWATNAGLLSAVDIYPAVNPNNPQLFAIRGTNYLFVTLGFGSGGRLWTLDDSAASASFTDVTATVTGLDMSDVYIMLASFNYLIAIKSTGEVVWSSTTTPLDFTPSLITGAGSARPNDLNSQVVAAYQCPEGFIIYTKTNAIGCTYTGNSRYPWKFREIPDGGAYASLTRISAVKGSAYHYGIDTHGTLRVISINDAKEIAPEISTWIRTCTTLDSYNTTTKQLEETFIDRANYTLQYLLQRYLVVAGRPSIADDYPEMIVYDTLLKRYGRLKFDFIGVWEYNKAIYAITSNGQVLKLLFDIYAQDTIFGSVLILGKFQLVRGRRIELQEYEIEGTRSIAVPTSVGTGKFISYVFASNDGRTLGNTITPYDANPGVDSGLKRYLCRAEGENFCIGLQGPFVVNTVQMKFIPGASR